MKGNKKKIIAIIIIIIIIIAMVGVVAWQKINKNNSDNVEKTVRGIDPPNEEDEANFLANEQNGTKEEPETYTTVYEFKENTTLSGEEIISTGFEENAILVSDGATATLNNLTITRNAEDSNDESGAKMFGIGAALLVKNSTVSLLNSTITTTGKGATGVFSYGTGILLISDTTITTNGDNAGGIHTASGGTVSATNVTVTTYGENSAAVRSESDGKTMEITGGTYTTNGQDSPAIYSLAEVVVKNATMTANKAEVAFIDGNHSITIEDSNLTGNMLSIYDRYRYGDKTLAWTVGIAQTTKEKEETAIGKFKMSGGSLTSNNGGIFYTSNTRSNIILKDVSINSSDNCDFFLKCTGNGNDNNSEMKGIWGTLGENGAICNFTAIEQEMTGDVLWDSISQLDFYMTDGSKLTGAVLDDETGVPDSVTLKKGYCNLYISSDSTWIVTGNSTLSTLSNEGKIVDSNGNQVTIKGTDGTTYVSGNSSYTVTVDKYLETADLTGALSI